MVKSLVRLVERIYRTIVPNPIRMKLKPVTKRFYVYQKARRKSKKMNQYSETLFRSRSPTVFYKSLAEKTLPDEKLEAEYIGIGGLSESDCTGCGACYNACQQKCIDMVENAEGFLFPVINGSCAKCDTCITVCPILQNGTLHKTKSFLAVLADDETRLKASSGGFFPVAAKKILGDGGLVCGAGWTADFRGVCHKVIDDAIDLPELYESKYLQSDTSDTFSKIKDALNTGRKVLYCGAPCQVAGLTQFLQSDYENLVTLGFICHGVPSPLAWKRWLDTNIPKGATITGVRMRDKRNGWKQKILSVKLDNVKEILETREDSYNQAFLKNYNLRNCCYKCNFKSLDLLRPEDITIGDFWGVNKFDAKLNDNKGVSHVLLNSSKAQGFMDSLEFETVKHVPQSMAVQDMLIKSVTKPAGRKIFMSAIKRFDFNRSFALAKGDKAEVCVLGHYTNQNIGGQLTVYATYRVIESLGYAVKIMRVSEHFEKVLKRQVLWERLCRFSDASDADLDKLNDEFDSFVTTPDWTFHKTYFKGWDIFMQPFTSEDKRRISFAASFGSGAGSKYKESDYPELKRRLSRFHALSVREPQSVDFCKSIGIHNARFMHDAVFSLDRQFYKSLSELDAIDRPDLGKLVDGQYAAVYLRDFTEQKVQWVLDIAAHLDMKPLVLIGYAIEKGAIKEHSFKKKGIKYVTDVTMCEWLYFIDHSEFVITDSFHATCFSLIFNKQFALFRRTNEGLLAKLAALAENVGMPERLFDVAMDKKAAYDIIERPIDWDAVNEKLLLWREEAVAFIDNALR